MGAENKRFLVIAAILLFSAAIIFRLESGQKKLQAVEESIDFPMELGDWVGEEIPVSTRTMEILETPLVVLRKFTNPEGEVVYFSGVFASRSRKAIHPPEVCLTGGGVAAQKDVIDLEISGKNYPTNKLVILPGKTRRPKEVIFYWYRVGDSLFSNFYAQQSQMAWMRIHRKPLKSTDVALLRISTRQRNEKEGEGEMEIRLKAFAEVLMRQIFLDTGYIVY